MHRYLLLALVATAAFAQDIALAPCAAPYAASEFLTITEYVVLDAIPAAPAALADKQQVSMDDYLKALGQEKPPIDITDDMVGGSLVRIDQKRWLVYTSYVSYVRRSAVNVIDAKQGMLHYLPPTPAVPGGAGALAQPQSRGVTLIASSGRLFCGVRSQARTLAVTAQDVDAFARMAQAPSAEALLKLVASSDSRLPLPK